MIVVAWLACAGTATPTPAERPAGTEEALRRLNATGETPVQEPALDGAWITTFEESGFGSKVQRRAIEPGVYEVDVELALQRDNRPWLAFRGHAVEAFGPHSLCLHWVKVKTYGPTVPADTQDAEMRQSLELSALNAAPCQKILERTPELLRLDNGAAYVERRP